MSDVKNTQQHPKVEIAVKNFGPITEANIDLRPLTVFIGPSNTGKTYFSTLVYVLQGVFNGLSGSDFLQSPFNLRNLRTLLDEIFIDFTISDREIQDLLKKLETIERPFKLSDLSEERQKRLRSMIQNIDFFGNELQNELKNCFNLNSVSRLMHLTKEQRNKITILLKVSEENQECWSIKVRASESEVRLDTSTHEDMALLPKGWWASADLLNDDRVFINRIGGLTRKNRYYLPAARSGIMQSHRIIASSLVARSTQVGVEQFAEIPTLSGIIADFMQKIILYDDKKSQNSEMIHLAETLETEVLAGQVHVKPSASGYPDFSYLPQGIAEEISLSQSSSMVSELAPLVLFLRGLVQPDDILIIEEPEAHLHPGAQADMAVILARLVRAGVKVIITTHSDWLLQEIGNLVLEGLLEDETNEPASWLLPEEVGIWHFQKDKPVKEIPFKPREGISPEDYEDVAEGLYNRSVNLQQRYEKKEGKNERESA